MSNNVSDIRVVQLANYVRPKLVENKTNNWVLNGKKNEFYQYIIDRYNGSPTNAAIINSYVDLMLGNGIAMKEGKLNDWVKFRTVLSDIDLRRIISDFILFGEDSMQIIEKKGGDLGGIYHLPKQYVVPSIANEDNEIEGYWYCTDWSNTNKNKPEYFPAFKKGEKNSIYCISPYKAGKQYFSDPDYLAGLPYAEMEEEISNYYISHIQNGLSFGYIINIPDGNSLTPEEKDQLEWKIKQKLTGSSNAGKFVLSFNGRDAEITVTPLDYNDAHKQWEYLTGEARQQLLTAHRVTSPMLFGIKDNTGLGNNADELDTAEAQLMKRVIKPKQKYIIEALEDILNEYGIKLSLYFKPLTEEVNLTTTQTQMHSHDADLEATLEMYAQDAPEGYDLYTEPIELSAIQKSEQDSDLFKIRYAYAIGTSKTPEGQSRQFCNKMMSLSKAGKVFRKEDIEEMSANGVNGQFAHSGGKYDIFLYAGGVNCYHRWERRIFKKRTQENGDLFGGNAMQNTDEVNVNEARRQGAKIPQNPKDVAIAEIDKPNKGKYPS